MCVCVTSCSSIQEEAEALITPTSEEATASLEKSADTILVDVFHRNQTVISRAEWDRIAPNALEVFVNPKLEEVGGKVTVTLNYHAFTTINEYYAFGDFIGLPLRNADQMDAVLYQYFVDRKLEGITDESQIPADFTAFADSVASVYLPDFVNQNKAGIGVLRKHCTSNSVIITPPMVPFMPPTWNNAVSSVDRLFIAGWTRIHDRWRFRDRLLNVFPHYGAGQDIISFCPGGPLFFLNDRMSSGWFLGL